MITSKIWEQGVGLQVLSLLSASLGLSYIWAVAAFTVCPHSPLRSAPYFFYSFVFCVQAVRKRALKWKRSHFYARHGLGKKWTSNPNSSSPFGTRSRRWMRRSVGRCPSLSWRYEMKFRVQKTKIRKNFRTGRTWTCNFLRKTIENKFICAAASCVIHCAKRINIMRLRNNEIRRHTATCKHALQTDL